MCQPISEKERLETATLTLNPKSYIVIPSSFLLSLYNPDITPIYKRLTKTGHLQAPNRKKRLLSKPLLTDMGIDPFERTLVFLEQDKPYKGRRAEESPTAKVES